IALREQFRRDLTHLRLKGIRYWLVALSLVPLGMLAGDTLGKWDVWVTLRYKIYHALQDLSPHFSKRSKRTVIVLIEDEEYWKGELARRVPLKRCYLARLVSRLDLADPAAIGLDVDLRSQTPDNSLVVHHDYQEETAKLAEAIRYTSANRCVVLPRTLERLHGKSVPEPAIFDNKGLMGDSLKV